MRTSYARASFPLVALLMACSSSEAEDPVPNDTAVDSGAADTTAPDTAIEDSSATDSAADTAIPDTSAPDSGPADNGPLEGDAPDVSADAAKTCAAPLSLCGSGEGGPLDCVDTRFDPSHCGSCSKVCGTSEVCVSGECKIACPTGQVVCNGKCVDTTNDPSNCGACTADPTCVAGAAGCLSKCASGTVCSESQCKASCGGGQIVCDGKCTTTTIDPTSCGGCGDVATGANICGNANTTAAFCSGSTCTLTCAANFASCDAKTSTGCETKLDDNPEHCGKCDNACAGRPHTSGVAATCTAGVCQLSCEAGWGNCKADAANAAGPDLGCETELNTVANCGACGTVCGTQHTTSATCGATGCAIQCAPGWGDCDGDATNGCETDLATTAAHCGACNSACAPANAAGLCNQGFCMVASCNSGHSDCDRSPSNGCEGTTALGTSTCPAASCAAIQRAIPAATSGAYTLDFNGGATSDAINAYCDMTTAGGGWTLVGRSVEANATGNFGWNVARGSTTDDTQPYSLNAYTRKLAFTELLVGNYTTGKAWGANVYRLTVPWELVTVMRQDSASLGTAKVVSGTCTPQNALRFGGYVDRTDAFYLRDQTGNAQIGLTRSGFLTTADCSSGGDLNGTQGMIMGRLAACTSTQLECGSCVDPLTDDSNCGACGNACGTNNVCEKAVCRPATNLARDAAAVATQSIANATYPASNAVDDVLTNFQEVSGVDGDWWQIDLGAEKAVYRIDLYNRTGCCQKRAQNLKLSVSSNGIDWQEQTVAGIVRFPTPIVLNKTVRYLRVTQNQPINLHLAEVRVWSAAS